MVGETPLTSLEVFKTVARLSRGACPPIKLLKGSKGEIPMQYLSIKKAREMLGWSPKMNFESGLLEAMAWYTEFFLETQSVELRIDNPI